jgi:tripartite-type tricarboxylate transporter receptor subunit TctC
MIKTRSKFWVGFLSLLIVASIAGEARAQSQEAYPTRPIEIIVPYGAGGGTDLFNRIIASFLSKKWGVPVNVINKPGGNAIPGVLGVYNAKPDGYTMLGDGNPSSSLLGVAVKDLPFKVMDRTFVARVGVSPQLFIVAANSPLKTLKDVAAEAKRDPGSFTWAMHGAGTDVTTLAIRQFFKEIGVDILKTKAVSVTGGGQSVIMVAGGHVTLGCPSLSSSVPSLKGDTLRGLALTSKSRNPDWPDLPTTAEAGYPSVNVMQWGGISGPPKLPNSIVAKWEKAIEEILKDTEMISKMKNIGVMPVYLDSKATGEFVSKETEEVSKLWGLVK